MNSSWLVSVHVHGHMCKLAEYHVDVYVARAGGTVHRGLRQE